MTNQIDRDPGWEFLPILPSVDKRFDPSAVGFGLLTKGVGVDVRTMGSLRLMPGFRRLRSQSSGSDVGLTANGRVFPDPSALGASHDATSFVTVVDFKRFTVEKLYNDAGTLRPYKVDGFWVRGTTNGTTAAEISLLVFHDGRTNLWNEYVLEVGTNGSGVATEAASIATFGNFLYYTRAGQTPKVWYWDTNAATPAFVLKTMGPGTPIPREQPCEVDRQATGGVLKNGRYLVAYRYANKHRWQYTAMSDTIEVEIPRTSDPDLVGGTLEFAVLCTAGRLTKGSSSAAFAISTTVNATVDGSGGRVPGSCDLAFAVEYGLDVAPVERNDGTRVKISGPVDSQFRTVQVFRSISAEAVGTFNGGVLYLEHEFTMPAAKASTAGRDSDGCWDRGEGKWERWVGNDGQDPGYDEAPNDEVLVSVPGGRYDPNREAVGAPPNTGVVGVFDETTFMVDRGDAEGRTLADVRWSSLSERRPESFPDLDRYRYTPTDPNDAVFRFLPVDRVMMGFSGTGVLQIELASGGIRVEPTLWGFGPVDRRAVVKVAGKVVLVHPLGAGEINSRTMDLANVVALDRRIQNEWGTTQANIRCCYDARYGGVYLLNTATKQMSVIGANSNAVGEVEDANFVACTEGTQPDETTPGICAFFITNKGLVVYPDAARANSKTTMIELTGTVSGSVTGLPGGTDFEDSGASFHADPVDCIIHFFDPNNVESTATVTARVSGTRLTLDALPPGIAVGWTYELSPVVFDVQFWKCGVAEDPRFADAKHRVRTTKAIKALFGGVSGGGSSGAQATLGVVKGVDSAAFDSSERVSLSNDAYNTPRELSTADPLVFPRVRVVRSDLRFDLLSVLVSGRVESPSMTVR